MKHYFQIPIMTTFLMLMASLVGVAQEIPKAGPDYASTLRARFYPQIDFKSVRQVSIYGEHICILNNEGVLCWGENGEGQTDVPELVGPTLVTTGARHTCAVDKKGMHCWGDNSWSQIQPPAWYRMDEFRPKSIFTGERQTCFNRGSSFLCLGGWDGYDYGRDCTEYVSSCNCHTRKSDRYYSQGQGNSTFFCSDEDYRNQKLIELNSDWVDKPELSNPTQLAIGLDFQCALDDTGVQCWGKTGLVDRYTEKPTLFKFQKLSHPTQIDSRGNLVCVLHDAGVHCGERTHNRGWTTWEHSGQFTKLAVGKNFYCAIQKNGVVKCWRPAGGAGLEIPALTNATLSQPTQLAVGSQDVCAIDDGGLHCWAMKDYDFVSQKVVNGQDEMAKDFLTAASTSSTSVRGEFLSSLRQFLVQEKFVRTLGENSYGGVYELTDSNELAPTLDLFYSLIDPVITTGDSDVYQLVFIPMYAKIRKDLNAYIQANRLTRPKATSPRAAFLALQVLRVALDGTKAFLMPTERSRILDQIQRIEKAQVDLSNGTGVVPSNSGQTIPDLAIRAYHESLKEVLTGFQSLKPVLDPLSQAPRVFFLEHTAENAIEFLTQI